MTDPKQRIDEVFDVQRRMFDQAVTSADREIAWRFVWLLCAGIVGCVWIIVAATLGGG